MRQRLKRKDMAVLTEALMAVRTLAVASSRISPHGWPRPSDSSWTSSLDWASISSLMELERERTQRLSSAEWGRTYPVPDDR
jgi:hypothetical protein